MCPLPPHRHVHSDFIVYHRHSGVPLLNDDSALGALKQLLNALPSHRPTFFPWLNSPWQASPIFSNGFCNILFYHPLFTSFYHPIFVLLGLEDPAIRPSHCARAMHLVLDPVAIELPAIGPHVATCDTVAPRWHQGDTKTFQKPKCSWPSPCMSLFWKLPYKVKTVNTISNSKDKLCSPPRTCSPHPT